MDRKALKTFPIADVYPFADKLLNDVCKHSKAKLLTSTSEEIDYTAQKWTKKTTYQITDRKEFIKIYRDSLKTILNLSATAQKLLWYILEILPQKAVYVDIVTNICQRECGFKTRKSVSDGIIELLEKEILIKTAYQMRYWVNPVILFNGDRVEFIREYIYTGEQHD